MYAEKNLNKEKELLKINDLVVEAMLMEVYCSPKPGLVDYFDSGSHTDMNYRTFTKSTYAFKDIFKECLLAGYHHHGKITTLYPELKKIGLKGERKMYKVTGGVNTQKGLLFSMGIICAAVGYSFNKKVIPVTESLKSIIKSITKGLVRNNFININKKKKSSLTSGEKVYLKYNITGIRGEVEAGFPTVLNNSLPVLKANLRKGFNINESMLTALLVLMCKVNDTNIISRGGIDSLNWMHKYANQSYEKYKKSNSIEREKILIQMNKEFVNRNLSPGGCADLLAITVLFYLLEKNSE